MGAIRATAPNAPVGLPDQVTQISELCRKNQCRDIREAKDDSERNRLWEGRRGAFGAVARIAPNYLVNDCTVPRTKLPEALSRVAEIVQKYNFEHGNVFHAGDGNLHPLIFFDSRDADQLKRVKKAGWEIMAACVELGGTISGEHGVGLEKLEAMRMVFNEHDLGAQRALQQAFDPGKILNPGKVIPVSDNKESLPDNVPAGTIATGSTPMAAEADIIDKIQQAASNHRTLLPTGFGTWRHFGNLSNGSGDFLNSSELDDIIEFDPKNQVIIAGSGLSLGRLQRLLAEKNQWLPIRPPFVIQGHSIGGVMALGACGPERLHYRAPRDLVLGLRFINGQGQKISTGGKVVKNVAGYDMTRLIIGSAGTLGLITEVACRVMTIPECCTAMSAAGSLAACATAAGQLIISRLSPVFIAAFPDSREDAKIESGNWKLMIGFEGFEKIVSEQLKMAGSILEEVGLQHKDQQEYSVQDGIFGDIYSELGQSAFVLRADLPLDELTGFVKQLSDRLKGTDMFLDFGCGRILAGFDVMPDDTWGPLCDLGAQLGGHLMMDKAPIAFKEKNDVFGKRRQEWKIMHRIKAALDPHSVFAPGRLPGKV